MTAAAYVFEAKSIQSYILGSGKLKDMVGGSELLEAAWAKGGLLDKTLHALELNKRVTFSRRAGGAFVALLSDIGQAESLRDLWTLVIQQHAPGMSFIHGIGEGEHSLAAVDQASRQARASANLNMPMLPQPGPFVARSPRTGNAATAVDPTSKERIDARTSAFRSEGFHKARGLVEKFGIDEHIVWPRNLEEDAAEKERFPLLKGNRYVAIVHADGNGLGELLMQIREELDKVKDVNSSQLSQLYTDVYRELSNNIETATNRAAGEAVKKILMPNRSRENVLPARPLVMGGDDLNMIVRGDLAIPFTECFLKCFEEHTKGMFEFLRAKLGENFSVSRLTACAGIAFVKVNQPFYLAYELAESLCAHAKREAKKVRTEQNLSEVPSALAFHRVTTSMISDYDTVVEDELTIVGKSEVQILSMQPYSVGIWDSEAKLPKLADLIQLCDVLQKPEMSRGPTRRLLSMLYVSREEATKLYMRWRDNLRNSSRDEHKKDLELFDCVMDALIGPGRSKTLPMRELNGESDDKGRIVSQTPLGDALALIAVGTSTGEEIGEFDERD